MAFDSDVLLDRLQALTAGYLLRRWIVAFSGGIDSTALLHALANADTDVPIVAVHIDHGLHPDSASWSEHCESVANGLGVQFKRHRVQVPGNADNGPEAAARQARYAALLSIVGNGDCLLSGHHENDQAETLLLNLMRGSGPAGLAGIGASQAFGRGLLLRPMLGVSGEDIDAYARQSDLVWIDDPSNVDTRFDRNFVRQEIMPKLASRWPAVSNRLRRSAELVGEASELLNELADIDLAACGTCERLSLAGMARLSAPRQRNLLRRAVRLCGLSPPPATRLYQAINELIPAREDAQPLVTWAGAELRRYREHLYILAAPGDGVLPAESRLMPGGELVVPGPGMGSIELRAGEVTGIDPAIAAAGIELRFRSGGEELRIAGDGSTRKLKKLLQEAGVLPWMRERLPLLYVGEELVAVGDMWISADHVAKPGLTVVWHDKPSLI